ncbi:hypothetical protein GE21DRAFT_1289001 [Neurospora crassa]|nr:hypothetical protein GE21DRAFT_1289001 [Neurospora crassa]
MKKTYPSWHTACWVWQSCLSAWRRWSIFAPALGLGPYIVNTHVKIIKFGVIALEKERDIITNHGQESLSLDGHGPLAHHAPSG